MKNKNIKRFSFNTCGVLTDILDSHLLTTQNPFTFLTQPPGGSTTKLTFYTGAGTKGESMNNRRQPGLSSQ